MSEKNLIKLEKRIVTKIARIKNNEISPKESEIGKDLNLLKLLDEPSYDDMIAKYKLVLKEYKGLNKE